MGFECSRVTQPTKNKHSRIPETQHTKIWLSAKPMCARLKVITMSTAKMTSWTLVPAPSHPYVSQHYWVGGDVPLPQPVLGLLLCWGILLPQQLLALLLHNRPATPSDTTYVIIVSDTTIELENNSDDHHRWDKSTRDHRHSAQSSNPKEAAQPPPPRMHASCEEGVDPEGRFILAAQPLLTGAD